VIRDREDRPRAAPPVELVLGAQADRRVPAPDEVQRLVDPARMGIQDTTVRNGVGVVLQDGIPCGPTQL
jgi:hypothetical protein